MSPLLLPAHVIRGAVQGQPTGDGTLPELKGPYRAIWGIGQKTNALQTLP